MSAFEELGLAPELIKAIEDQGWLLPSPVQAEAIPLILGGGDVMAAAETGSGKTGAFALPVLQIVHESLRMASAAPPPSSGASASSQGPSSGPAALTAPCAMSTEDRDALFAVAPDGLRCQTRSEKSWGGGRASRGAYAGRVYYEVQVTDEGLARVGWSTAAASLDLGTDRQGFGFGGTGKKSHARQFETYGEPYGLHDVIGCLLDCDGHTLSFTKNGKDLGVAFSLPPHLHKQALYPTICLKNAEVLLAFGGKAGQLRYGPPQGYTALGQATTGVAASAGQAAPAAPPTVPGAAPQPLCIILEPSRDLAEQTHTCIVDFAKHFVSPSLRAELLVGGVDANTQLRSLKEGVHVVTGTPGRIIDFLESGKLAVEQVRFFVLDEADRLIDNDMESITKLFKRLPKGGSGIQRLQVLLFSATLHSKEVKEAAAQLCQNPILVDLKGKDAVPEAVDHVLVEVDPREDRSWLQQEPRVYTDAVHSVDPPIGPSTSSPEAWSEAVKRLKPRLVQRLIDAYDMSQALIFCRTNFDCDNLEKFLVAACGGRSFRGKVEGGVQNPYSCLVLGGARSMQERRQALQAFKDGDIRFLICTDVAARGLDIRELPYVINVTLPDRSEDYIHRVGRVGRADTLGLAISLVSAVPEKVWYCTVKGYKPWLEPNKSNTCTQEHGGHTIWYDEKELLQAIEARLSRPITRLGPDLALPDALKQRLQGSSTGGTGSTSGTAVYGQARGTGGDVGRDLAEHRDQIKGGVETLARLEIEAQRAFLGLRGRVWGL